MHTKMDRTTWTIILEISDESKGSQPKILHFYAFFGELWPNNRLVSLAIGAPVLEILDPPLDYVIRNTDRMNKYLNKTKREQYFQMFPPQ